MRSLAVSNDQDWRLCTAAWKLFNFASRLAEVSRLVASTSPSAHSRHDALLVLDVLDHVSNQSMPMRLKSATLDSKQCLSTAEAGVILCCTRVQGIIGPGAAAYAKTVRISQEPETILLGFFLLEPYDRSGHTIGLRAPIGCSGCWPGGASRNRAAACAEARYQRSPYINSSLRSATALN